MTQTRAPKKKEKSLDVGFDDECLHARMPMPKTQHLVLAWCSDRLQGMQMGMLAGGPHPLRESLELRVSQMLSSEFASLAPWRSENGEKDDREDDDDDKEEEEEKDDDDEDGQQLKNPEFPASFHKTNCSANIPFNISKDLRPSSILTLLDNFGMLRRSRTEHGNLMPLRGER